MITKLKNSLTAKIFLITCLLLTSVCVLTYGLIARLMPLTYAADREHLLQSQGDWLAARLGEGELEDCAPLLLQFSLDYDVQVSIKDSQGNTVGGTDFSSIMQEEDIAVTAGIADVVQQVDIVTTLEPASNIQAGAERWEAERWETATAQSVPYVTDPENTAQYVVTCTAFDVSFQNSAESYTLFILGGARAVNQAVEALGRIWPWLAAAILLVAVLSSLFYAWFITRPVLRLSGIAQRFSELDFSWRCGEKRTDEIGTLAGSLDTLADRLAQAMQELQTANAALQKDIEREVLVEQAQLEFFSAVSHELKTPITILKGQLGGMLDGIGVYKNRDKYLTHSLAVVQQMEGLVQELLLILRLARAGEPAPQEVELTALVRDCLRDYDELFGQREQKLAVDLPAAAWVRGEPLLLQKAVGNLLANAALYSPPGAAVQVALQFQGGQLVLTVENEGGHIPPEALPHLFEAFFRGDPSRNRQTGGSGLGLYLVQKIALRHGGSCQIQNSAKGVIAALRLPNSIKNIN